MKRILTVLMLAVLSLFATRSAHADGDPIRIYTAEDLLRIAEAPGETYCLEADIDMDGIPWPAFTFTGELNGCGHVILNLNTFTVSDETRVTYDGNRKTYDTHFAALFAIMEHASVHDLRLINVSVSADYEGDCFLGTIAGYMSESRIENCEITGTVRLDINGKMFGVGGIAGYGNGEIKNCKADVTLVNVDTDKDHRDEQFLGGVCSAGYPDIDGCTVNLAGYISDHGYVHSGGLVGMYIVYPQRFARDGYIKNNQLDGFITFFEDNTNRRAYCEARCGEIMDWQFSDSNNVYHFTRDERYNYSVNLLPHGDCGATEFSEAVVEPTCTDPGYTAHICTKCGYMYRDSYVLPAHKFSDSFEVVKDATVDETGLAVYTCVICGATETRTIPKLSPTPVPTDTPVPTATVAPAANATDASDKTADSKNNSGSSGDSPALPIICGILILASILLLVRIIIHAKRMRRK